ncbi:MAG: 4-hydroxy-tetrahydrodipicolinate reductase, partial [Methylotenera sp.]|nr:4-hydroxy-tetrahydrodipicolinate reductase [Methylotenera sp.]
MVKVVIAGATGRMGHALIESVLNDADCALHGALDRDGSPQLGRDAGEQFGRVTQVQLSCDVDATLKGADVLIDFTRPEASMHYLEACRRLNVKHVIG